MACRELWKTLRGKFVTVEGVLVETLDHGGFVTFRIRGRNRFTILPEP